MNNERKEYKRLYYEKNKERLYKIDKENDKKKIDHFISMLGGKCVKCSSTHNLEFDHVDPKTKSFNITSRLYFDLAILLEELKKCQLLCFDCHTKKGEVEHGGGVSGKRNCKCNLCREKKAEHNFNYKHGLTQNG